MRLSLGNKPKLLKMVLHSLIDRTFLSNFTWTGKASRGQRKIALKTFTKTTDLLHSIVAKIDNGYEHSVFLKHLVDKILKHAYV